MKKLLIIAFSCVFLLLAGCKAPIEEEPLAPIPTIPFEELLSMEEIKNATAIPVANIQHFEDASIAYFTEDATEAVYLSYSEMSLAEFDEMLVELESMGELTDAPNLAEKAVWCESTGNLLVYDNGRALDVRVEYDTVHINNSLLACRQLAALLLGKW